MKRRLLMLLSVFMTITSVGWLQAADTSGDGYTKTDDGNYTVTTAKGLQNVLGKLKDGVPVTPTITLANDLDITGINFGGPANALWQGIFYLNVDSSQIKSLTIDGAGHSIIGKNTSNTEGGSFDPTKNYVFYFDGSGSSPITFKDLTVKNTNILAFNLYNLNNLVFNKVALNGNAEGGLHLNSSQLTATDFTTSGNGKFAVKLSRQVGNMPKFTLVSGTISEDNVPQIAFYDRHAYSEWSSNPTTSVADIIASVVTPGNDKWYRSLQLATMHTSNNGALAYVWTKSNDAVTVNTAGQLDSTINLGFATVNKVNLAATTYELGKQLVINRPLVISGPVDGEKAILTANANATWPTKENKPNEIVSSTANLISIEATGSGEVSISNLTVKNSKASGINVQPAEGITTSLKNIYLENNAHAGLLVHGIAKAEGLHTIGNVWGGVNVDKKQSYSPKFTFTADCSFDEPSQIWAEKENVASSNVVTLPSSGDWRMFEGKGGANNAVDMYYWTNASLNKEVKDANELVAAINTAQPGQVITLTGKDYGDENAIQSFGTVKAAGVTIKAADATKKPKVYGTIKILAENCTIDGLDMYTKSDGSTALKNIIDVVAMSATITNNVFNMGTPTTGNVSNGLCIWPYGTAEKASYVVKGNTFNGFKATVTGWSSTAFSIVENIDLSRFELSADQKSKVITIANEKELWTGNTFVDCYSDYIHSNFGGTDNSPLYTFAAISSNTDASSDADASSNTDALETAIHYSGDNAQVYAKGSYTLTKQLELKNSISVYGVVANNDTTTIKASGAWDGVNSSNKHLISIEANNSALENLIVEGSKSGSGINVYKATGVTLNNVISRNNVNAGLIVNGSTVKATNFRTSGNTWYGVNVDKGEGVEGTPVFTIGTGCSFAEAIAIYADLKNASNDDASTYVVSNDWVMTKVEGNKYRWVNAASSGIDYAITSVPATVVYGSANLPLISNADSTKTVKFSVPADNDFVSIKAKKGEAKYDSLQILKPGLVTITMSVGDTTVTQQLEVLKRQLTIKGVTAKSKTYDGNYDVTLDASKAEVSGYVDTTKVYGDLFKGIYGTLTSKDAGIVPVELKAFFETGIEDSSYYDLNYVTVMDTVKKKDLTVTAVVPKNSSLSNEKAINYGTSLPAFTATTGQFVTGESVSVLGGKLQFDCPATSTSLAGTYPVMPYGYTSNNYNISYVADSLKIKAINPTAEITNITVNGVGDNASITVSGRVLSNGGTPTDSLKATITPKTTTKSGTATTVNVAKDGTFKAEITKLEAATYTVALTVSAGNNLTSTEVSSGEVDLNAKLQNVNFVSEVSRLTYGSTAKLSAKDFAEGAKVTFAIAKGGASSCLEQIDSTTIKAIGTGTATITVTAEKDGFITAVAKQTVTVEPKNLTATPGKIEKAYDGTLTATLPEFTLNGIIEGDKVTVSTSDVTASFVDKNVGTNKPVILTGNLTLTDTNATNYTLTQPTNLKGTITKGSKVTVTVSDVKRKYNEKTLKYKLQIMAGEVDLTSTPYTGKVVVTEESGTYKVETENLSFPNYGDVTVQSVSGKVEIEKGTPKVLTYNTAEGKVEAELLDAEGWNITDEDITVETEVGTGYSYAQVSYNNRTQTVRGASLTKQAAPNITWQWQETKALRATKAGANLSNMIFGESKILVKDDDFTYSVVNTKVLTLTTNADGNYVVNAVGVGTGAITATNDQGAVAYCSITVDPAVLTVSATGTDKTYDNTPSANVSLTIENMPEGVALDLNDVTFNYASANVGSDIAIEPSKPLTLTGANAANYVLKSETPIKGNITPRDLTITSPISKYYDGSKTLVLSGYSAEGLIAGEAVPTVTATFKKDAAVDVNKEVTLKTTDKNYKLTEEATGNIVKSTLDATLPTGASGVENLKNNVKLVVRETGATVTRNEVSYEPTVTTEGSGSNTVYYISGGDNDNYSVVYGSNQLGFKADPITPPSGGDETVTITLDATTKDLPRTEEFVLTATVSPAGKTVVWSSSDPTVASVTADGNKVTVKGVKVGTATITATIGDVTATCEVTVGFATGLEEALANTEVFGRKGNIYVNPIQPLQVTVVNMIGKIVYNARISGNTQIPVTKGIYIVKLTNAGNSIVTKVNVY